jgi:general secretion pathway protein L
MDLATFSHRIRRADFLDGLGISLEPERVSLAHVSKRLLRVVLRHGRTSPIAPSSRLAERTQSLAQAVTGFVHDFNIEPAGVHLCLGRQELLLNRLVLPAAARENIRQVLEYEIERVIPLPRDDIFYDYQVRESGGPDGGRLAVLVVSVPRRVVHAYIDALDNAGVRPKAVVIAAAALGDYTAFCRGALEAPLALVAPSGADFELALFADRKLVASHALRGGSPPSGGELQQLARRDLAEVFHTQEVPVELLYATPPNGAAANGDTNLFALASGRLEAPADFFEAPEPALLPAVGAALGAVREGTVDINLLPEEHRPGLQEGLFVPIILLVAVVVLALIYGGSVIVRDEMTRRSLARETAAIEPQVAGVRKQEAEVRKLQEQLAALTADQDRRVVTYVKELTDRIPPDAYLTSMRFRSGRIELDGFAKRASELIQVLESSPRFQNVQFTSPTTAGQGGQERFSIVAEVEG